MLGRLHSEMFFSVSDCEFNVSELAIYVRLGAVNRNTHETRLCVV